MDVIERQKSRQPEPAMANECLTSPFRSPRKSDQLRNPTPPAVGHVQDLPSRRRSSKSGGGRDMQRPMQWRMKYRRHNQEQQQQQQQDQQKRKGGGEEGDGVAGEQGQHEGRRRDSNDTRRRSSDQFNNSNGPYEVGEVQMGGEGVMTIEMIMHKCGRNLIEPSAVSAPMDFLTSEAEFERVWQV